MRVKRFIDFINEAYLKGGRQPLYHFTGTRSLLSILKDDELKTSKPSRQSHGMDKSISLTRNIYYTDRSIGVCFELDSDKLLRDGYKIYPVDEWAWKGGKPNKDAIKGYNFNKSNFTEVKSGRRGTKHGLDLPKSPILETEFEERIYKNVKNIGKYIISIYIEDPNSISQLSTTNLYTNDGDISIYLDKYPHIKIYTVADKSKRNLKQVIEVTDYFSSKSKSLNP